MDYGIIKRCLCYYITVHENVQHYANNNNVHIKGQSFMYNKNVPRGQVYASKQGKHVTGQLSPTTEVLTAYTHKRGAPLLEAIRHPYLVFFVEIVILMICVAVILL